MTFPQVNRMLTVLLLLLLLLLFLLYQDHPYLTPSRHLLIATFGYLWVTMGRFLQDKNLPCHLPFLKKTLEAHCDLTWLAMMFFIVFWRFCLVHSKENPNYCSHIHWNSLYSIALRCTALFYVINLTWLALARTLFSIVYGKICQIN